MYYVSIPCHSFASSLADEQTTWQVVGPGPIETAKVVQHLHDAGYHESDWTLCAWSPLPFVVVITVEVTGQLPVVTAYQAGPLPHTLIECAVPEEVSAD